jgi:hypothetical protein
VSTVTSDQCRGQHQPTGAYFYMQGVSSVQKATDGSGRELPVLTCVRNNDAQNARLFPARGTTTCPAHKTQHGHLNPSLSFRHPLGKYTEQVSEYVTNLTRVWEVQGSNLNQENAYANRLSLVLLSISRQWRHIYPATSRLTIC